jgi:hypothetical protein
MTKEEIIDIEVGDYIYVEENIYRTVFDSPLHLIYKPDNFYLVTGKVHREINGFSNHSGLKLKIKTTSEIGEVTMFLIRNGEVRPVQKHLHLVKKDVYNEINKVDFFGELQ